MAFKKKNVKRAGRRPRKSGATGGRRRLTGSGGLRGRPASKPYTSAQPYSPNRRVINRMNWKTKARTAMRIETSDNITSLKAISIGRPKKVTFDEKVRRISSPPVIYKRNYAFSAECSSGRKGWFQIPINHLDPSYPGGSMYDDAFNNFGRLNTNSPTGGVFDPTILGSGQTTQQKVYVEYLSQYLRMVNSGTNSISGTINLVAYKRDVKSVFANTSTPLTPVNLMMLSSTNNLITAAQTPQQEATVGNGWAFDTATAGVNYNANYVMPGSTVNSGGATAQTDPHLNLFSTHIKDFMDYYFKIISKSTFSLKPGQQVNQFLKVNDSPVITRETIEFYALRGITFYLVVEFEAGVVGSSVANNVISTGSGQLSCIMEEKRIIGLSGRLKSKLVMQTAPLAGIAAANQQTINPDTGIVDIGYDDDA